MKKQKHSAVRLICVIIACSMLIPLCASCSQPENGEATTAPVVSAAPGETTSAQAETTRLGSLPEDLNFDGQELDIIHWSNPNNVEFNIEEEGDAISTAIYRKDRLVSELLGVKPNWIGIPGAVSQTNEFLQRIEAGVNTNESEIVAGHSIVIGSVAAKGFLQDLTATEYLDFDNPWWPHDLIENTKINGKLFFASGDISNNTILGMEGIFFNKSLVETDVYSVVREGKWTLERLMSETANAYRDLNSNGKDNADYFGYSSYSALINALFIGSDIRFIEKNADEELVLSDSFVSEKTQGLLEKLNGQFHFTNDWIYESSFDKSAVPFLEGRCLFYGASVRFTINKLPDSEVVYGIIPMPKYSEDQKDYRTIMANTYTLYGITKNVGNTDCASAFIEAMGQEGYRTVSPVVFEVTLKSRYSDAPDDAKMFDIIRDSVVFEIGMIFNSSIGKLGDTLYGMINARSSDWMSYMKSQKSSLEKKITALNNNKAFQ